MTRTWLIVAASAASLGLAACGDYDQEGAYEAKDNAAYGAGNEAYEAPADNAAYAPPENAANAVDGDANGNEAADEDPAVNANANRY